ncbi:hypothetical protein H3V53_35810 [Paraburkholderia bengalensis]|uniref:Uncharacterized protein n=1 Tax=Paraburkholderia bengalensis TaxID=2747562 RepID=A0ABU8J391_9BURK
MLTVSQWNTDSRTGARQTYRQLLLTAGDDARRRSMHTPVPSRCTFHGADVDVQVINSYEFDTCTEAFRFTQLPVFRMEQSGEHAWPLLIDLPYRFLLHSEGEILCDELANAYCPSAAVVSAADSTALRSSELTHSHNSLSLPKQRALGRG